LSWEYEKPKKQASVMLTKKEQQEAEKIEIRSDEVKEILGQVPKWIVRWGTTLIFIIAVIFIAGSGLFKYPDIQPATIILTTENPPADLIAKTNGKIVRLFVEDKQKVNMNDYIALLESAAVFEHVIEVGELLKGFKANVENGQFVVINKSYSLGEIQTYFATFFKNYQDFRKFADLNYHQKKIKGIKNELAKYDDYYSQLSEESGVLKKELALARKQFERDSLLYKQGVLSASDYEKSQATLLRKEFSYKETLTGLATAKIEIGRLNQEILDLELEEANRNSEIQNRLFEAYDKLVAEIDIWKQKYLLSAPVGGIVTFNKFWSVNQNVVEGEVVFTILPEDPGEIVGKIDLSVQGAGKVKAGQKVNIKFANYPHMEFGMVRGEVTSISLVPTKDFYTVKVKLTNGLVTNYGYDIKFQQEMPGTAEIITENMSLLKRIFNPAKSVIKRQKLK
jgi:multidrug resistance efflux pump